MFQLHYHCENNGDGSVSVKFHGSEKEAEAADAAMDDGWGESSASCVKLKFEDGKLFYLEGEWVNGEFEKVWKPVEEV